MEEIKLPSKQAIKDMKILIRALTNKNCQVIINYLIKHGASSIAEMADATDVPYRTLQTNQYYMIAQGMLEYRAEYDQNDRKVLWFTRKFNLALQGLTEYDLTIKQYLDNQTKHNVNGTRFQ